MLGLTRVHAALGAAAGLGVLVVAVLVSCGSVNLEATGPRGDGGTASDAGAPPFDAATADAPLFMHDGSPSSDAGAPKSSGTLAINASPDLREIRLCIRTLEGGGAGDFLTRWPIPDDRPMPESNYPGIPPGGGTVLPAIRPFDDGETVLVDVIYANKIEADVPPAPTGCSELICAGAADCLTENADYFELTAQAPAPISAQFATVLAVTGCVPSLFDSAGSVARCGPTYTQAGNLAIVTATADARAPFDPTTFGLDLAQLSPSLAALGDGGASASFGALSSFADASFAALPPYPGVQSAWAGELGSDASTDYDTVGFTLALPPNDAGAAAELAFSLTQVTEESDPTQLPAEYLSPQRTYLFAIVGDPTSAAAQMTLPDGALDPAYDGHGLHVIALPATLEDAGALVEGDQ